MSAGLRCFFAVPAPTAVIQEALRAQRELAGDPVLKKLRWVRREQMHVTLRFIGEVAPEALADWQALTRSTAALVPSGNARLGLVDAFPSKKRSRVIVAHIDDLDGTLQALEKELSAGAVALGLARERRAFAPHLTLGRLRSPCNLQASLDAWRLEPIVFSIRELCLYRSELRPEGARHHIEERARLRASE